MGHLLYELLAEILCDILAIATRIVSFCFDCAELVRVRQNENCVPNVSTVSFAFPKY